MLLDLRKSRTLRVRDVKALIVDSNRFNRNLMSEIMRAIDVGNVVSAGQPQSALDRLHESQCTVVFLEVSELNEMDALGFARLLREQHEDHIRRIPIIATSSQITKHTVIDGRNAAIDEFLKKPCSPNDVISRLKMVVETPRPFVESNVYVGPCRRRKNPADYHGPMRRTSDTPEVAPVKEVEKQFIDKGAKVVEALERLKLCCTLLASKKAGASEKVNQALFEARKAAAEAKDLTLVKSVSAFENYISAVMYTDEVDIKIVTIGVSTLEQLAVLPQKYASARETVANAFQNAIQKKMVA